MKNSNDLAAGLFDIAATCAITIFFLNQPSEPRLRGEYAASKCAFATARTLP